MNRIDRLKESLESKGIEGILITNLKNIRYLSSFTGSYACLFVSAKMTVFCTDFRYMEQARQEVSGIEIMIEKEQRPREIIQRIKASGIRRIGFESTASYEFYRSLLRKGLTVKAVSNLVEDMRKIKDDTEMSFIMKAIRRAENAFKRLKPYIKIGITEKQLAGILEENLKKEGCRTIPFDIIVAAGRNSALPHARPTDKKIKPGDFIIFDWGGEAGGYFSDMTRTLIVNGRNITKKREIYMTVLDANRNAIFNIEEGKSTKAIDRAARDVIRKAGYGEYFGHGTGHGVGLDVHELPRISRLGREYLKEGMVFTVEPGIYIPGIGGVRIEDMVYVSRGGYKVLTTLAKEIEIIN